MIRHVEILYPHQTSLYGEGGNARYLRACLEDAEFVETGLADRPAFSERPMDLILLGSMTESDQSRCVQALRPYRAALLEALEAGARMLATGNALELFGSSILAEEKGEDSPALDLFPYRSGWNYWRRYNGHCVAHFQDPDKGLETDLVGYKSQFSFSYPQPVHCGQTPPGRTDIPYQPLARVERGIGMNPETRNEGFRYRNFFGTHFLGPFLILNPDFCRYLIQEDAEERPILLYETEMRAAYAARLKLFRETPIETAKDRRK